MVGEAHAVAKYLNWGAAVNSGSAGKTKEVRNKVPVQVSVDSPVPSRQRLTSQGSVIKAMIPIFPAACGAAEEGCCEFASNPGTALVYTHIARRSSCRCRRRV